MKVQDITQGTKTRWWVAAEDADTSGGDVVRVQVKHVDGGLEDRYWDFDQDVPTIPSRVPGGWHPSMGPKRSEEISRPIVTGA